MGKIKRVAGANEPVVRIKVVVEPVVVQNPAVAIPVEIPRVAVVIRIQPDENV